MKRTSLLRENACMHGSYIGLCFYVNWAKLNGPQYFMDILPTTHRKRRRARMRRFMLIRRLRQANHPASC